MRHGDCQLNVCTCLCTAVALVGVVCAIVLVHHIREARRLRYPLKDYPALAPEMLLAAVKAVAYG
jgi:hypothetical protein